jgi:hypothetical protein
MSPVGRFAVAAVVIAGDFFTLILFGLGCTESGGSVCGVTWLPLASVGVVVVGAKALRSVGRVKGDFAIALAVAVLLGVLPYALHGDPAGNFGALL